MDMSIKRGISLVETMAAMMILSVGLMGLAVAFQYNIMQAGAMTTNSQATIIAESVLGELLAADPANLNGVISTINATWEFDASGDDAIDANDGNFRYTVNVVQLGVAPDDSYQQLAIRVNWTSAAAEDARVGTEKLDAGYAYELLAYISPNNQ